MNNRIPLPSISDIRKVLTLDGTKLPSFPQVAIKLLQMTGDEASSLEELSRVVESDPGIAARVMEIVNSALYGLQRKIKSLPEAIVLLGFDEIKRLTIGMTVFHGLFASGRTKAFDRIHFWRHSLSVAVLAMELAKEMKFSHPEEAYIAGLLHDVGKLFLDLQGHRSYGEFLHNVSASQENRVELERDALGLGHDDTGAFFCSIWNLPDSIVLPVKYHHQRFQALGLSRDEALLISIVALSDFVCWTQGIGSFDMICPPVLPPEVEEFIDVEPLDLIARIRVMNREMERISEFYQFVFPTPRQIEESLLFTSFKLSRANTRYFFDSLKGRHHPSGLPNKDDIRHDLELEIAKILAKAKTVKEVLDVTMFQIGSLFEPVHWSLLLKDPKSGQMVFTAVEGANKERLQGIRLPEGKGIAGYILEKGNPLLIDDLSKDIHLRNRLDKYAGFTPQACMGALLRSEKKVFGAIELINRIRGGTYNEQELNMLVSIAEYAAIAIERTYFHQALQKMVTTDSLTSLKNRYSLERTLGNSEEMLKQYGPDVSIMIIDIDNFKRINEIKGRRAADGLLKQVAAILRKTFRRTDDIFRYEGDKFIALLSATDSVAATQAKQRILNSFDIIKGRLDLSVSIFVHSVKTDHATGLIPFLEERLARDKAVLRGHSAEDLEENLQPFLEEEMQKNSSQKAKTYRKKVSLNGQFVLLGSGFQGRMRVEGISLLEVGFTITSGYPVRVGDFLDISFHLDDQKGSLIERRVIVRNAKENQIEAEFYNPPPYAKNLGFYLMA